MVEVRNKGNEPLEGMLRRFSKRWQQSGIGRRERKKDIIRKLRQRERGD